MTARANSDEALLDDFSRLNNELTNAQRELMRTNAELAEAIEIKDQFLGMVAHDLRNPIGAVLGMSEVLLDDIRERCDTEQIEYVEMIQQQSELMLGMVNEYLDVASIESGKLNLHLAEENLGELIRHNVQINKGLVAKKNIHIHLDLDDIPTVCIDAPKIEQVLNNLISNAAKFSDTGSNVWVRAGLSGGAIVIDVRDEGQGIPSDELSLLFRPFSTTSAKTTAGEKSTGLGLSIVKKIVEGHGGQITVNSELGVGTTFHVSLPLVVPGSD